MGKIRLKQQNKKHSSTKKHKVKSVKQKEAGLSVRINRGSNPRCASGSLSHLVIVILITHEEVVDLAVDFQARLNEALADESRVTQMFGKFLRKNAKKKMDFDVLMPARDLYAVSDALKVADIVLACSSPFVDPEVNRHLYDQFGYDMVNMMVSQGMPYQFAGISLNGALVPTNVDKRNQKRYYQDELTHLKQIKILDSSDLTAVLQHMSDRMVCQYRDELENSRFHSKWSRGFMLVKHFSVNPETQETTLVGVARGQGFAPDFPVHLTGHGDFEVQRLYKKSGSQEILLTGQVLADEVHSFHPFRQGQDESTTEEDTLEQEAQELIGDEPLDWQPLDDDSFDDLQTDNMELEWVPPPMEPRAKEDLDFPDERDYGSAELLRERFSKYRGLQSWRTCKWPVHQDLPAEYRQIYQYSDFGHVMNTFEAEFQQATRLANTASHEVAIVLKNCVLDHPEGFPLIVSTLFTGERKATLMHGTMLRTEEAQEISLVSKKPLEFHSGFRRWMCRPIYSEESVTDKAIYLKESEAKLTRWSAYMPTLFTPAPLNVWQASEFGIEHVATGTVDTSNPKFPILKRIILTGYPHKINRNGLAVIRWMFFNREDVEYFKPLELWSKKGLRGHIVEAISSNGVFKARFSGQVTHDDIICLSLFRRQFPPFPAP